MSVESSRPQARTLDERLLITKIITCVALAFLMILGAWSAAHPELDGLIQAPAASAADSPTAVVGDAAARAPMTDDYIAPGVQDLLVGMVGCVLGILCTFILLAVIRRYLLRRAIRNPSLTPRPRFVATATRIPLPRSLSLAQLSLSRT